MIKVLFVCLGNICRSAMAQGVLEQKVKQQNLSIRVDSAGTSNYHIGDPPDYRMIKKGLEYNIDISTQRARQFTVSDFDEFDYIFAMDKSNLENINYLARNNQDKQRVKLFLDYPYPNQQRSVPDPYYGGQDGFEEVYQLLNHATDIFIKSITHE
ncbi:MAG: low molecular weight protein-tyrosine-phosphatase [Flavobacteriales bacterium]